eukprot:1953704-Alexandrium_andersonii.AAC.1
MLHGVRTRVGSTSADWPLSAPCHRRILGRWPLSVCAAGGSSTGGPCPLRSLIDPRPSATPTRRPTAAAVFGNREGAAEQPLSAQCPERPSAAHHPTVVARARGAPRPKSRRRGIPTAVAQIPGPPTE